MPSEITYSEHELVAALKTKDRGSFDYLYKNYSAVLYGIIHRVISDDQTAQDVLQEVFIKIYNNIEKYSPEKGRLYTWMLNVARNTAIDKLRSKGEVMKGKIQSDETIVYSKDNDLKIEQQTDEIGLRETVAGLSSEHRVIVELAYFKGFTLNEIAKSLDIPLGTIKTRMRKAIGLLRQHYRN